jgi:hypothetical protein
MGFNSELKGLTDDYYDDNNITVPTATNVTHEHVRAVT